MDLTSPARLGVFGGSFDPIHIGHLFIAEEAAAAVRLERVLFLPTGPAHHLRAGALGATAEHRAAMVRLAVEGNPLFEISLVELERSDPAFTVDTLGELHTRRPAADLYFIVGSDALGELPRWRDPEGILRLAHIVAVERGGRPPVDLSELERVMPAAAGRVTLLEAPGLEVSATSIRARIAAGRSIRYLVPDSVREYIDTHGLYR